MPAPSIDRVLARAGVTLTFLALLVGLAIPRFTNPRQALAAHVSAILAGLLLMALASSWHRLALSAAQRRLAAALSIGGAYGNLLGSLLAASWGTNRLTPMAGLGLGAEPWKEMVVQSVQVSQAVALLVALGLVIYGLRRPASA